MLPIGIELVGHEPVERVPRNAAGHHVVHQPREVAGQCQSGGRTADHERRQHRSLGPGRDKPGKREAAIKLPESWRNIERLRCAENVGFVGEYQLVLVDVAERDDARQDHRIRLQLVKEQLARQPHRAPRRQIERGVGETRRIAAGFKSFDQPAVDQRGDDAAQERHGDGNTENAHGLPDSRSAANIGSRARLRAGLTRGSLAKLRAKAVDCGVKRQEAPICGSRATIHATLSRNASSAACTASGVPTCIQTPSSLKPNRRSFSLASSNVLVSENSPFGAPAKIDGDMIAAPA